MKSSLLKSYLLYIQVFNKTVQDPRSPRSGSPFKPLTVPFKIPLQPLTGAPFKGELVAVQKPDKYQNDQHAKMSAVIPKSTLYDCPIWAPFKPLTAPFIIPLQPPSEEITSLYSITRYTKMFSSARREKCTL